MRKAQIRTLVVLFTALFVALTTSTVHADDRSAREAFEAGVAAAESSNWQDALTHFERAHADSGRAWLLFNIASMHRELEDYVRAAAFYHRFFAECIEASCDVHREAARAGLAQSEAQLATLVVHLPELDAPIRLTLDGENIAQETRVNPGTHTLEMRSGPNLLSRDQFSVEPGERRELMPTPGPESIRETRDEVESESIPTPEGPDPTTTIFSRPGTYIAIAGVALAGLGATFLFLARSDEQSVQDAPDGAPWADHQERYARSLRRTRVGWPLLAVGVIGAVVGVTLTLRERRVQVRLSWDRAELALSF